MQTAISLSTFVKPLLLTSCSALNELMREISFLLATVAVLLANIVLKKQFDRINGCGTYCRLGQFS